MSMKHRIIFIRDSLDSPSGGERVFINLANDLSSAYDVYIVNRYQNQPAYEVSPQVKGIYYLNEKKRRVRYSLFGDVIRLRRFLQEKKIDVAIASGRTCVSLLSLACVGTRLKTVMSEQGCVHGLDIGVKKRGLLDKALLEWCLRHSFDRTVLLTKGEISLYRKRYPRVTQVEAIYNSIDDKLLVDISDYDVKACKIITVGRMHYVKGYEYLIDVAQKVLARHPDWRWDIYGDGEAEYKEKIAALIRERGLEGRLTLCGNRSDIYDLYQNYGIYVMTSRYEGFGMVLLEAKVKKLPLVSFDINSGPSDIIEDGVSGYLIPPFDTDAMAEKICELIEHPELRQKFSNHAWDNIDKFRKEAVVQQWVELIDGLVAEGNRARIGY